MKRTNRAMDIATKEKISASMKKYHSSRTQIQKQQTAKKQSDAQKRYWATIPKKDNNTTIEDIML